MTCLVNSCRAFTLLTSQLWCVLPAGMQHGNITREHLAFILNAFPLSMLAKCDQLSDHSPLVSGCREALEAPVWSDMTSIYTWPALNAVIQIFSRAWLKAGGYDAELRRSLPPRQHAKFISWVAAQDTQAYRSMHCSMQHVGLLAMIKGRDMPPETETFLPSPAVFFWM